MVQYDRQQQMQSALYIEQNEESFSILMLILCILIPYDLLSAILILQAQQKCKILPKSCQGEIFWSTPQLAILSQRFSFFLVFFSGLIILSLGAMLCQLFSAWYIHLLGMSHLRATPVQRNRKYFDQMKKKCQQF